MMERIEANKTGKNKKESIEKCLKKTKPYRIKEKWKDQVYELVSWRSLQGPSVSTESTSTNVKGHGANPACSVQAKFVLNESWPTGGAVVLPRSRLHPVYFEARMGTDLHLRQNFSLIKHMSGISLKHQSVSTSAYFWKPKIMGCFCVAILANLKWSNVK